MVKKASSFGGNPGFEKWDKASKDGQIVMVVGNRFLVTLDGDDIDDTKILQEFAGKIDTSKLASLK